MCYLRANTVLHPAGSTTGRYYQENRLAHLPAHVLDVNQVAGRRREGCPGTPAACLFQNDDGWLHAGIGSTQTPGTSSFGGPDHAHGQGWTRMNLTIVVECCGNYNQDASKLLILWRPRRDLNPCYRRERPRSTRLYNNLEGAGGAARPLKLRRKNLSLHDCYMPATR